MMSPSKVLDRERRSLSKKAAAHRKRLHASGAGGRRGPGMMPSASPTDMDEGNGSGASADSSSDDAHPGLSLASRGRGHGPSDHLSPKRTARLLAPDLSDDDNGDDNRNNKNVVGGRQHNPEMSALQEHRQLSPSLAGGSAAIFHSPEALDPSSASIIEKKVTGSLIFDSPEMRTLIGKMNSPFFTAEQIAYEVAQLQKARMRQQQQQSQAGHLSGGEPLGQLSRLAAVSMETVKEVRELRRNYAETKRDTLRELESMTSEFEHFASSLADLRGLLASRASAGHVSMADASGRHTGNNNNNNNNNNDNNSLLSNQSSASVSFMSSSIATSADWRDREKDELVSRLTKQFAEKKEILKKLEAMERLQEDLLDKNSELGMQLAAAQAMGDENAGWKLEAESLQRRIAELTELLADREGELTVYVRKFGELKHEYDTLKAALAKKDADCRELLARGIQADEKLAEIAEEKQQLVAAEKAMAEEMAAVVHAVAGDDATAAVGSAKSEAFAAVILDSFTRLEARLHVLTVDHTRAAGQVEDLSRKLRQCEGDLRRSREELRVREGQQHALEDGRRQAHEARDVAVEHLSATQAALEAEQQSHTREVELLQASLDMARAEGNAQRRLAAGFAEELRLLRLHPPQIVLAPLRIQGAGAALHASSASADEFGRSMDAYRLPSAEVLAEAHRWVGRCLWGAVVAHLRRVVLAEASS